MKKWSRHGSTFRKRGSRAGGWVFLFCAAALFMVLMCFEWSAEAHTDGSGNASVVTMCGFQWGKHHCGNGAEDVSGDAGPGISSDAQPEGELSSDAAGETDAAGDAQPEEENMTEQSDAQPQNDDEETAAPQDEEENEDSDVTEEEAETSDGMEEEEESAAADGTLAEEGTLSQAEEETEVSDVEAEEESTAADETQAEEESTALEEKKTAEETADETVQEDETAAVTDTEQTAASDSGELTCEEKAPETADSEESSLAEEASDQEDPTIAEETSDPEESTETEEISDTEESLAQKGISDSGADASDGENASEGADASGGENASEEADASGGENVSEGSDASTETDPSDGEEEADASEEADSFDGEAASGSVQDQLQEEEEEMKQEEMTSEQDAEEYDESLPFIMMEYDNNNAVNGSYFSAPRTLTLLFLEAGFAEEYVTFTVRAGNRSAKGISFAQLPEYGIQYEKVVYQKQNPFNTLTIGEPMVEYRLTFSEDQYYEILPSYTDALGRTNDGIFLDAEEEEIAAYAFTIDTTAPEITVTGVTDGAAYNGKAAPCITFSDINYDAQGVQIMISGASHEMQEAQGVWTQTENGCRLQMPDFAWEEEADDVYTLTISAVDLAGNTTERQICFSVNRYGSNFVIDDGTQTFLESGYARNAEDIVICEYNLTTIEQRTVSCTYENERTQLTPGTDYMLEEVSEEAGWIKYIYTFPKTLFSEEGRYSVEIMTTDAASNSMTNRMKNCTISFVIDRTEPTVILTGLEAGTYQEDSRTLTVTYYDDTPVVRMKMWIGDDFVLYNAEELAQFGGVLTYEIGSQEGEQWICVEAMDAAGNTAYAGTSVTVSGSSGNGIFSGDGLFSGDGIFSDDGIFDDIFSGGSGESRNDTQDGESGRSVPRTAAAVFAAASAAAVVFLGRRALRRARRRR